MAEQTFISPADGNEVFQAQYIPKQKGPPSSDSPSMKAYISTFPALGQVTQVDQSTRTFTALLEIDECRSKDPWQVSLWHSESGEWHEVPMTPLIETSLQPTSLQASKTGSNLHKMYFTTDLPRRLPTSFTIKFRSSVDQSWKWVKDHQAIEDGTIILRTVASQDAISSSLADYVQDLNPTLKSENHQSQSPGTTLWSVEVPIGPADGAKPNIKDVQFGVPWGYQKFSR
jgi:hypothetical protein